MIDRIKKWLEIYSCNYNKNRQCRKSCCQYVDGKYGCTHTTEWKYARKTPINYIKRIVNKFKGGY